MMFRENLDFNNFITYANFTLEQIKYDEIRLSSNLLYVDENSFVEFKVFDSFNVLIKVVSTYSEDFIDIILDVYSFKIKNEASMPVNFSLRDSLEAVKRGYIFPEEVIEFQIASGDYQFNYSNPEDNSFHSLSKTTSLLF